MGGGGGGGIGAVLGGGAALGLGPIGALAGAGAGQEIAQGGNPLDMITGAGATRDAIAAQERAAAGANATQKYMYDTTRQDQAPWLDAGKKALGDLQDPSFQKNFTMADFQADPGYAFRMQEGQKALERSAAAKGGLNSGAQMKALTEYGQNQGAQEYQNAYNRFNNDQSNRFNRLSSIAGIGQTASGQVANAGQNYANQVSGNQVGMGNAQGAAYIGQANRMSSLLGQGAGAAGLAFSDERLKTDVEPVNKADLDEMKAALKAYRFKYKDEKHGDGEWIGVMAQDLEKTKLGRTLVTEDSEGNKMVNLGKMISLVFASWAEA